LKDNSKGMSFVYEFDLKKDIPHFERLPDQMKEVIERQIAIVIYESFVIPGDEDYLTARLLAQRGLFRAFYWAAEQTIEKYLKAFLLFNGGNAVGEKYNRHVIKTLFDDAARINTVIRNISMKPHAEINFKKGHRKLQNIILENIILEKFIEDIEAHGSPDNRYNSCGVEFNTNHLFALDNIAYAMRGQIGVPSIEYSFKSIHNDLIATFVDNNPLFCRSDDKPHSEIPSESFPIISSVSVTRLDFLIKNKNDSQYITALRWLKKKMKLPKKVAKEIDE
jgi:hypothetical protein